MKHHKLTKHVPNNVKISRALVNEMVGNNFDNLAVEINGIPLPLS